VTSRGQVEELRRVLAYPKLKSYISALSAHELLGGLPFEAVIADTLPAVAYSHDPADNIILVTINGRSDLLVTGDKKDLLVLKSVGSLAIVTARKTIGILEGAEKTPTRA
jgi:putative PIN family toxin of toxin-antitoxin system